MSKLDDMVDLPSALQSSLSDRYPIEREIGAGGMAMVYLARDLRHARPVALKVLRADVASVIGAERFRREVTLTAALQHPHVLPLFDSGEAAGQLFYVMPYVEGESLREKLRREGQLRVADVLDITRQVADALDYAHSRGIVHRDIKPANVLLDDHARAGRIHALVADFGIARVLPTNADLATGDGVAAANRLTKTGLSVGTPLYMSPEQMMGDSRIDARSDLYSLACLVYEMLTGEPPFSGATPETLAARKMSGSIPPIASVRRSVPRSVDAVLARALSLMPADRFASPGEFAAALGESLAASGNSEASARRGTNSIRRVTRNRRVRLVVLGAVAMATVGVAGWVFTARSRRGLVAGTRDRARDPEAIGLYRQAHDEIDQRTAASIARAVNLLQRAIARDSSYADAWADLTRALVFAQNNRYGVPGISRDSLSSFTVRAAARALEADSTRATSWLARAQTLYFIDPTDSDGSIRAARRAVALDSNSADAWHYLGTYYEDALRPDSALTAFRRAIATRPTHPQALSYLALHFMWQRQLDSARKWADSAARTNPTNVLARQARGLVLIQQGRSSEAEDDFTATVNLGQGPERVWGWTGLGVVASRRHDLRAADTLTSRAIADADTLHPSHHEAVYMAWLYTETGQRERALRILERFPRPRNVHFQLHLREFTLDSLRREPRFAALVRTNAIPAR